MKAQRYNRWNWGTHLDRVRYCMLLLLRSRYWKRLWMFDQKAYIYYYMKERVRI